MHETVEFLLRHGYMLLFFFVLAEQLGLPIPATPMLIAAGALAGLDRLSLGLAWALAVLASLIGDSLWFYLGRTRGLPILRLLCRISLEPDTCVRRTQSSYATHGVNWLLFAKFVPGLSTIAPPMAGLFKVSPWKFIALDAGGAGLWAGAFMLAGWSFRNQLEDVAFYFGRLGAWLGVALVWSFVAYLLFKYVQRRRVFRSLRMARITPLELKERMDAGVGITVVDLRNPTEWREGRIPGSLTLTDTELDAFIPGVPAGEIVLYCSCPNEVTAARAAIRLRSKGLKLIRPLEGGIAGWIALGFPVETPPSSGVAAASASADPR